MLFYYWSYTILHIFKLVLGRKWSMALTIVSDLQFVFTVAEVDIPFVFFENGLGIGWFWRLGMQVLTVFFLASFYTLFGLSSVERLCPTWRHLGSTGDKGKEFLLKNGLEKMTLILQQLSRLTPSFIILKKGICCEKLSNEMHWIREFCELHNLMMGIFLLIVQSPALLSALWLFALQHYERYVVKFKQLCTNTPC